MFRTALLLAALAAPTSAFAQETPGSPSVEEQPDGSVVVSPSRQRPPPLQGAREVTLDFVERSLWDLVLFFADLREMNFVLADQKELQGKTVTIISHRPVKANAAWEAFLSAMSVAGYTVVESGGIAKVVKSGEAAQSPIPVGKGAPSYASDGYVTQLIQLENVSVSEVNKVITSLMPPEAKVVAYQPTNTLIITDTATNIRKVYSILNELDVAAPKSSLRIVPIHYADASDIKAIIDELYGDTQDSEPDPRARRAANVRRPATRTTRGRQPADTESVTAGEESRFISKVISDERTNALIVLANDEGHEAVLNLVAELDRDVDPQNRAQIHVVYLEHAKAEEVASVLSELSQQGSSSSNQRRPAANARQPANPRQRAAEAGGDEATSGAIAAFDSGMRIAADDNTNSLVIIANTEDFKVVESVIRKLDIERKQVFVDAVILELASEDSQELGLAAHLPIQPSQEAAGMIGGQFGAQSLGLSQDMLTGLAVGVFGESVDVPMPFGDGVLSIPAFGIVLNALKANSSVNIVSNPNITTLDNQEAEIVVGRRIPFPTNAGMNSLGHPVVSFQREDVAITLRVTPRINSSNYVTLDVEVEVQEIEEDDQGMNIQQSGPITSKRQEKTTVLVKDNQTIVLGGLVGTTDTEVETKLPILGDLPVLGVLFRGTRKQSRKTNLMIFLTPHIINGPEDMLEVQRIKEAQRQEFMRRFYGRSRDDYFAELRDLLRYSLNYVDEPSMFRGPAQVSKDLRLDEDPISEDSRRAAAEALRDASGRLPDEADLQIDDLPDGELANESAAGGGE